MLAPESSDSVNHCGYWRRVVIANDCHMLTFTQARGHVYSHPDWLTTQREQTLLLRQEEMWVEQENGEDGDGGQKRESSSHGNSSGESGRQSAAFHQTWQERLKCQNIQRIYISWNFKNVLFWFSSVSSWLSLCWHMAKGFKLKHLSCPGQGHGTCSLSGHCGVCQGSPSVDFLSIFHQRCREPRSVGTGVSVLPLPRQLEDVQTEPPEATNHGWKNNPSPWSASSSAWGGK